MAPIFSLKTKAKEILSEAGYQKHLSSVTYLSAAVKTTYFIESVYSKLRQSGVLHTFNLNSKSTNSTLKSSKSYFSRVNIHRIYTLAFFNIS